MSNDVSLKFEENKRAIDISQSNESNYTSDSDSDIGARTRCCQSFEEDKEDSSVAEMSESHFEKTNLKGQDSNSSLPTEEETSSETEETPSISNGINKGLRRRKKRIRKDVASSGNIRVLS